MSTRLPMKTHTEARRTLARLIREYHRGTIDETRAKTFGYLFSVLLAYFRLEADLKIENDIKKLMEVLKDAEVRQLEAPN
jgi:hypothetical protein